jgi:hypothetical protein
VLLVALALAADPPCPGAQLCDGQCIALVEVCPGAAPVEDEPSLLTAVPANDLCTANPLPRPGEPPVPPSVKEAAQVICTVAMFFGRGGCDHRSPMLYERPADVPLQPCGGPAIPADATATVGTGR